jgi:hypothetical protein
MNEKYIVAGCLAGMTYLAEMQEMIAAMLAVPEIRLALIVQYDEKKLFFKDAIAKAKPFPQIEILADEVAN